MNPLCACGCGREVSRPYHRFYFGCGNGRAMSDGEREQILDLYSYGFAQKEIAQMMGCSQGTISNWVGHRLPRIAEYGSPLPGILPRTACKPQQPIRADEWNALTTRIKEKKQWQTQWIPAKRELEKVKRHLSQNRSQSRKKESRPAATSPN